MERVLVSDRCTVVNSSFTQSRVGGAKDEDLVEEIEHCRTHIRLEKRGSKSGRKTWNKWLLKAKRSSMSLRWRSRGRTMKVSHWQVMEKSTTRAAPMTRGCQRCQLPPIDSNERPNLKTFKVFHSRTVWVWENPRTIEEYQLESYANIV